MLPRDTQKPPLVSRCPCTQAVSWNILQALRQKSTFVVDWRRTSCSGQHPQQRNPLRERGHAPRHVRISSRHHQHIMSRPVSDKKSSSLCHLLTQNLVLYNRRSCQVAKTYCHIVTLQNDFPLCISRLRNRWCS